MAHEDGAATPLMRPSASIKEIKELVRKVISFKDLRLISLGDMAAHMNGIGEGGAAAAAAAALERRRSNPSASSNIDAHAPSGDAELGNARLCVIMVGLPARGKTFLCNKIKAYLNWCGHPTQHFNVGAYRRRQKGDDEVQDAAFFDHANEAGRAARERAFRAALDDMLSWLRAGRCQVSVFDATNSTAERRAVISGALADVGVQAIYIESVCSDPDALRANYLNKILLSPDYTGIDCSAAVADFMERIGKYEEVYEPINDRRERYVKLTDATTPYGHIDLNRISGYLPGRIVVLLMNVCKASLSRPRRIWLTRHGESEYNVAGRIGGDSGLSSAGEAYAAALPALLRGRLPRDDDDAPVPVCVWTSTLRRTTATARHLPFPKVQWRALDEIDAGVCDGLTYEEIAERHPDEYAARRADKLRYRYPRGESYLDVVQRLEPAILEAERESQSLVICAHQAVLRAVLGYFTARQQDDLPSISVPLHTVIELTPLPDGTVSVELLPAAVPTLGGAHGAAGSSCGASEAAAPAAELAGASALAAPPVVAAARAAAAAVRAASGGGDGVAAAAAAGDDECCDRGAVRSRSSSTISSSSSGGGGGGGDGDGDAVCELPSSCCDTAAAFVAKDGGTAVVSGEAAALTAALARARASLDGGALAGAVGRTFR